MSETALPRGVRNNNPGNLVQNSTRWTGLTDPQTDARFCTFDTAENGIRALALVLLSYQREGYETPAAMITRYAPISENDTQAYISFVSAKLGVTDNQPFSIYAQGNAKVMIMAIIAYENANYAYPEATIDAALVSAGVPF